MTLCKLLAFAGIIAATISSTSNDTAGEKSQIPLVFRQWPQTGIVLSAEALSALKHGVDYYSSKRYAAALDALPRDQDAASTALGDYLLFYRAKCRLMMKQYREALEDFRLIEKRFSGSSLVRGSLMGQCQALLELKDAKSVLAVLSSHKMEKNAEALYYQGRALEMEGEKGRAIELYLQVYAEYPTSNQSDLAERSLLAVSPGALKGAKNYDRRMQRAENLLKAGEVKSARAVLAALGPAAAPDSKSSQKRILLMAEAEYRLGRISSALAGAGKVTAEDPVLHAKAIYFEAACCRKLDREKSFLALRDKALKLYPLSGDTEEICYSVATYYDVNYERRKSSEAYEILHRAFPKGRHAEIALWKVSLSDYLAGECEAAAKGFWNYLLAYPDPSSAASAMYWMGRCYEKLGDSGRAKYFYRRTRSVANDSYYGQRAREAEGALKETGTGENHAIPSLDFKQVSSVCDNLTFPPALLQEPDSNGAGIIERARQLTVAGLPDLAIAELRWGIGQYPQNSNIFYSIMSLVYAGQGDYSQSISCIRRVFPDYNIRPMDALYEEAWRALYPMLHGDIISAQASRTNLDSTLILGLIRQESGFKENARSRADARGLMQILPSTGRKLAKQAKMTRYSTTSLFKAETNIALGTQFLASLLEHYGRTELALAAYNAGKSRVDRWLEEFGDDDMAEFVEQIPFSETRGYVKQVMSNKAHYDLLTASAARQPDGK